MVERVARWENPEGNCVTFLFKLACSLVSQSVSVVPKLFNTWFPIGFKHRKIATQTFFNATFRVHGSINTRKCKLGNCGNQTGLSVSQLLFLPLYEGKTGLMSAQLQQRKEDTVAGRKKGKQLFFFTLSFRGRSSLSRWDLRALGEQLHCAGTDNRK